MNKKAFLFSIDAFLASVLLISGLVLLTNNIVLVTPTTQSVALGNDVLSIFNVMTPSEINNSWVASKINDGTIKPDSDLLTVIGTLWAEGFDIDAKNLTDIIIKEFLPDNYYVNLTIDGDSIYVKNTINGVDQLIATRRMVSGIAKGVALKGSTSTAYLKRIRDKENYVIKYIGGFIGQGNITFSLDPLLSTTNIRSIILSLDTIQDFKLFINGVYCTNLVSDTLLSEVQMWDVSSCNSSLVAGVNNFTFETVGDINDAYIAGGFIKINYLTNEFQDPNLNLTSKRFEFPKISGIINLYDSFYAQGVINSWVLNLTFKSNYTTYLRIGNDTIFSSQGSDSTQNIQLSASNLSWSPTTIPIRLGTTNFSNITMVSEGTPADTILVTDVSGSMDNCGEYYTGNVCHYECYYWWWIRYNMECPYTGSCSNEECGVCNSGYTDQNYYTSVDTICNRTRLEVAQSADSLAVDIILNQSGNEVGTVSYSDRVKSVFGLSSDINGLNSEINSYSANGATCICCGINRARQLLDGSVDKKFMIVMSDGDANYRCDTYDTTVGTYDTSNAAQSTIDAGQYACSQNVTVFTIGFGTGMSAQGRSTLNQTACNSSLYYSAINESELEQIYKNISNQILLIANFTAQTISISGGYVPGFIYDGYIDFNYTSLTPPPSQNEISVKLESSQFSNCSGTLYVPPAVSIIDAVVTSYSGPYWTSGLKVNNNIVYNLSDYNYDYVSLGDPFIINIPTNLLVGGINNISLTVEDNNHLIQNCSDNNSIFYTGLVNSTIPRSQVLESTEGCEWALEFEDGSFLNVSIPSTFSGTKRCNFTNSSHDLSGHNPLDAYDYAVYSLIDHLDFDDDGRIFVNLKAEDLEIIVTLIGDVPYLWGPAIVKLVVGR